MFAFILSIRWSACLLPLLFAQASADSSISSSILNFQNNELKFKDTNNVVKKKAFKKQANAAAVRATRAMKAVVEAQWRYEQAEKMLKEVLQKKEQFEAEKLRRASQKSEKDMRRDQLDKLNEEMDALQQQSEEIAGALLDARKDVETSLITANALYKQADETMSSLQKTSGKESRARDRSWMTEEMKRMSQAQEKISKLRDEVSEATELTGEGAMVAEGPAGGVDASPEAVAKLEKKLHDGKKILLEAVGRKEKTDDELKNSEEQMNSLHEALQNAKDVVGEKVQLTEKGKAQLQSFENKKKAIQAVKKKLLAKQRALAKRPKQKEPEKVEEQPGPSEPAEPRLSTPEPRLNFRSTVKLSQMVQAGKMRSQAAKESKLELKAEEAQSQKAPEELAAELEAEVESLHEEQAGQEEEKPEEVGALPAFDQVNDDDEV